MPYRRIPGRTYESPLRHWLRANLPAERLATPSTATWDLVRRYVDGVLPRDLAAETDLSPAAIEQRVRRFARTIGYQAGTSTAWLLPSGELANHAARRNEATGCLMWTGAMDATGRHPYAKFPGDQGRRGEDARPGSGSVRKFLWERQHGPVPARRYVVAGCGDPRCLALEHAVLATRSNAFPEAEIALLRERKDLETATEAAERLGVTSWTVVHYRGKGGKRLPPGAPPSPLRAWLIAHLPAQQPASVDETDWRFARRFAAGEALTVIGREAGVTRQMAHLRVKRVATQLGWTPDQREETP